MIINACLSVFACILYVASTYHTRVRQDNVCESEVFEEQHAYFYDLSDYILNAWFVADFVFYAVIAEETPPSPSQVVICCTSLFGLTRL